MIQGNEPIDKEIAANGLRFHYREWGDASAPPVLIFHGITGHSREWDPLSAALADEFHVVAVDQRGHGTSDWASTYAAGEMAQDILGIIEELGLDAVRVVGHSMGAVNSYLFAAEHVDRVERLAVVDVSPDTFTAESEGTVREFLDYAAASSFGDPEEALVDWQQNSPLATEEGLRLYVEPNLRQREDGRWVWRFDARGLVSFIEELPPAEEQWEALGKIACPVLIIRGAESEFFSEAAARRLEVALPNARTVEIAGAGHDVHIDQPQRVVDAVRGFLTAGRASLVGR